MCNKYLDSYSGSDLYDRSGCHNEYAKTNPLCTLLVLLSWRIHNQISPASLSVLVEGTALHEFKF